MFWEGPRKTELNSTRRITELKLQIVLKEGGGGSHELILSLGVRNSALGTADLPWVSLGANARHRSHHVKIQKGTQDGIPQSGDFCRDSSNSGLCRGLSDHALPALSLQPLLGGVPCSPSLAHSSSVYRAVHIYHIYHLQVHMSYPGSEIFHIPPSPSALPVSAPTGTGSQTNLTKEVILFYFFFLSSRRHRKKILL